MPAARARVASISAVRSSSAVRLPVKNRGCSISTRRAISSRPHRKRHISRSARANIIDRVIGYRTPLLEAAKCALISFDSTIKSNLSVGRPADRSAAVPPRPIPGGTAAADCRRQGLFPADSPRLGRRLAPGIRGHAGAAVARMKRRLAFGCGHASMEKSLQESQP